MELEYELKKSRRAKNIRLTVRSDSSVLVTVPWWVPKYLGKKFFDSKKKWIIEQINKYQNINTPRAGKYQKKLTRKDYLENKEKARMFILERLEHFNQFYNFRYSRVAIRDVRTRWGSCSRSGNLNFCYKLLFLSPELADYIVVHELCHLGELNHSTAFWSLVKKTMPDYKKLRKALKGNLSLF